MVECGGKTARHTGVQASSPAQVRARTPVHRFLAPRSSSIPLFPSRLPVSLFPERKCLLRTAPHHVRCLSDMTPAEEYAIL